MEATYFDKNKFKMKDLELIFDDNENVLEGIQKAMYEHTISKAEVIGFEGKIRNISINYFQKSSMKNIQIIESKEVVKAKGEFQLDFTRNTIFGRVRIMYKDMGKTFEGILVKAKAVDGLKITLRYLETVE